MLGSRMRAAVVFHSCHPRPDPVTAGVITDRPPLMADQPIPSRLYARWTPSSPLRVKYENRYASDSTDAAARGAAGTWWQAPSRTMTDRRAMECMKLNLGTTPLVLYVNRV